MPELQIKKKHIGGNYMNISDCPLARAAQEHFDDPDITVGADAITVGIKNYRTYYGELMYREDTAKVAETTNPEEVIRTLTYN